MSLEIAELLAGRDYADAYDILGLAEEQAGARELLGIHGWLDLDPETIKSLTQDVVPAIRSRRTGEYYQAEEALWEDYQNGRLTEEQFLQGLEGFARSFSNLTRVTQEDILDAIRFHDDK